MTDEALFRNNDMFKKDYAVLRSNTTEEDGPAQRSNASESGPSVETGNMHEVFAVCQKIIGSVGRVIVGKDEQVTLILAAYMASGHVLLEDIPGVGKTLLARTFAEVLGHSFKRIQFTPDTLPGDVTGVYVFNQKNSDFEWRSGPIFANIILADELNRATPRTQSSLLEAMEERQVTVEGVTQQLPRPFMVIATQNPIDMEGTFPLPEAQLDRFLISLELGYLSHQEEAVMIERFVDTVVPRNLRGASTGPAGNVDRTGDLDALMGHLEGTHLLQNAISRVKLSPQVTSYILSISERTRIHPGIILGVSPRGSLYLARLAKAYAAIHGRDYVLPDDVKAVAVPCLAHRIIPRAEASLRGKTGKDLIRDILTEIPVPIDEPESIENLGMSVATDTRQLAIDERSLRDKPRRPREPNSPQ